MILEEFGINSYVLATQQQPVKASYFYMVEAIKTQKPKVFIFEAYMVNKSGEEIADAVISDAIDPLPLSLNKLKMTKELIKNKKDKLPFYFSLFRYKDRWSELTNEDFHFNKSTANDVYKGYVFLTDKKSVPKKLYHNKPKIEKINAEDLEYLNKMIDLCSENDISLILMYAPFSMSKENYYANYTMKKFAEDNTLDFIDGYSLIENFDFDNDFYDDGHLNCYGSQKLSKYIGEYLKNRNYF